MLSRWQDPMQPESDPEGNRDQANGRSAENHTKCRRHVSMMRFGDYDGKNGGRHGCLDDQHRLQGDIQWSKARECHH
jgi:hypothetical protein